MPRNRHLRTSITVLMDILVVVALVLTLRVIVEFFGAIASQGWAQALIAVTDPLVVLSVPAPPRTPYGGVFDAPTAIIIVLILLAEWALSVVRARA